MARRAGEEWLAVSYILDALKKSEQERSQSQLAASAADASGSVADRRGGAWKILAAAAVMGVSAAVIIWVMTPGHRPVGLKAPDEPSPPSTRTAVQGAAVGDLAEQVATPVVRKAISRAPSADPATAVQTQPALPMAAQQDREPVKFLRAMAPEFQRRLPRLVVNIHVYSPDESERILYINNRQYTPGDRIGDGVVVEEIVRDGAVLSYQGMRFKLPRPN